MRKKCRNIAKESLKEKIKALPSTTQEQILLFVDSVKGQEKGRRYSRNYLFDCTLLKIKSASTYRHLRNRKILPLPSESTIYRYLKKLKPSFGFQHQVFDIMKEKSMHMIPQARQGNSV